MIPPLRLLPLALAALLSLLPQAHAKSQSWTPLNGKAFKGEPGALVGPYAVFKTGSVSVQRILLHDLSPADCVRFYEGISTQPERAAEYTEAKSALTREILAHSKRVSGETLIAPDLKGRPEPELFLLYYVSHGNGNAWKAANLVKDSYLKIAKAQPGLLDSLFIGVNHRRLDHARMAFQSGAPGLVTDFDYQNEFTLCNRYTPGEPPSYVLITRTGCPISYTDASTEADALKGLQMAEGIASLLDPTNPKAWPDRLHYLKAILPVAHQNDTTGPTLIGHPLKLEALRDHGIVKLDADFEISADGQITKVELKGATDLRPEIAAALTNALTHSLFVAAVDHGKFVSAPYRLHLDIPF